MINSDERLRVWHIAETYPPAYGGGAAIYIQDVARALAGRGHEVRVFCAEDSDTPPYTVRTDYDGAVRVDRVSLPYLKKFDPDGWQLGIAAWRRHEHLIGKLLRSSLHDWRPDLVHYSAARPFGEECLLTIAGEGVPIVGFLHEAWLICTRLMLLRSPIAEPCPGPQPLRCAECMYSHYDGSRARAMVKLPWRILKLGLYPAYRIWRRARARKCLSGALGYSQFMVNRHQRHIKGQVTYVPLGINLAGLNTCPPARPREVLRFGFLAGFQQTKGILHVLDAAAALKRSALDFELHVWGPNLESGRDEVAKRELQDRVFLRGMYAPDELWDVYAEIDVALMATTVCEPFGRIPLEAAASGAPTIAPAIGGITETIRDGVDGLLYEFRDPKDLERKMRRVLEEPGLVSSLIENLRPVRNTLQRGDAVEQFYYQVLGIAFSDQHSAVSTKVALSR